MATLAQLITRVLAPLRDADQNLFGDAELISYFNEVVVDLCSREKLIREIATVTASGGTLAVPSASLQIRWVKNPDGAEVAWMDESTFFSYQAHYPEWNEDQPLATIYDQKIYLHPAAANGTDWEVGFYGIPEELDADSDTFPLPRIWEERAIRYVRAECFYKLGDTALGDRDMAQYESGLRPSAGFSDAQVPGKLNFAREPNVFDRDPDSIHLGG